MGWCGMIGLLYQDELVFDNANEEEMGAPGCGLAAVDAAVMLLAVASESIMGPMGTFGCACGDWVVHLLAHLGVE